ncbi:MAG: alginate lyase family protein [Edaphobacter sp.]
MSHLTPHRIALFACALLALAARPLAAQAFEHPGVLLSRAQLDFVKAEVKANVEPFKTQFQRAKDSEYGDLHYKPKGPPATSIIECGSSSHPNFGCKDEDADSAAAYVQALLWYITGNPAYAKNAIQILNAYQNLKAYTNSNAPLQSAWSGGKWTRAAEIIRYSNAGWAPADIQRFSDMLTKVVVPIIYDGSSYNGNWELTQIEAMMGIAVFTDNHDLFDHAVVFWKQRVPAYFYYQPIDGNQPAAPPRGVPPRGKSLWAGQTVFNATLNGMPQEACRDFHHSAYGLSATMAAAETAHIQGLKLYESEQPRLTAAMEFMSYYQLKNPVPQYLCGGSLKLATGSTFVIGYNEYHNRLGQPLPYTRQWIETGVLTNPLPTDIGAHTAVFETLTHIADAGARKPAAASPPPSDKHPQ